MSGSVSIMAMEEMGMFMVGVHVEVTCLLPCCSTGYVPGVFGQEFGYSHARDGRFDRAVGAAVLRWGVGLGVVRLQVAGPAVQPDDQQRRVRSPRCTGPGAEPEKPR